MTSNCHQFLKMMQLTWQNNTFKSFLFLYLLALQLIADTILMFCLLQLVLVLHFAHWKYLYFPGMLSFGLTSTNTLWCQTFKSKIFEEDKQEDFWRRTKVKLSWGTIQSFSHLSKQKSVTSLLFSPFSSFWYLAVFEVPTIFLFEEGIN